jgi:bifunctional enzyme CysN/CysC
VPDDHVAALAVDSRRAGTRGGELDYALLLDGLAAEREQGITIDVAYRYFATARRSFIVADTPGHEQYTRNMVTGASTADCAVLLLDARKGVLTQTRRHLFLATLLGVHHVALAVNKMDLVGFSPERFAEIEGELRALAAELGIEELTCIPVCAVDGDNVVSPSERTPWYEGPTVLGYLETVEVDQERMARAPFRMPVQLVLRPDAEFRGFAGTVGGGTIRPGDRVRVLPSGLESTVARIVTFDGDLECAVSGQAVTLTLADEIDVSRGDVLAAPADPPAVADQLRATVVWMAEQPMLRGRSYLLRLGTAQATATAAPIKHKVDVATMHHLAANRLELNEIGAVDLELDRPLAFDPYRENRETGGFILVDRVTNDTVGAGMLDFALRRAANLRWQPVEVDKRARAALKAQRPCVVWLTGRPSAGKSTIANLVERELLALGHHTYLLDGDNVRHGLTKDLGFTSADRVENIRRVAEVARLMTDAGLIAIVSFISPFRSERRMARDLVEAGEFLEVFVDAPLDVAEARDPKGLYAKARRGELRNFTGIDSPYEPPEAPELRIDTTALTPAAAAARVVAALRDRGVIT